MRTAAVVTTRGAGQEQALAQELGEVRRLDRYLACNGFAPKEGKRVYGWPSLVSAAKVLNEMAAMLLGGWKNYDALLYLDGVLTSAADIQKLIDFMDKEPAAGAVGPAYTRPYEMGEAVAPFLIAGMASEARLVSYVPLRMALFRMEALRDVGKFGELLLPHLVMPEWGQRAMKAQWGSMILPSALAAPAFGWEPISFDAMTGGDDPDLVKLLEGAARNSIPLSRLGALR